MRRGPELLGKMRLWIVWDMRPWIVKQTRLWVDEGKQPLAIEGTRSSICWENAALHLSEVTRPLVCEGIRTSKRSPWSVTCGYRNAVLITRLFMHEDLTRSFKEEPALTVGDACLVLKIQASSGFPKKKIHVSYLDWIWDSRRELRLLIGLKEWVWFLCC